jgi:hypothetical protein
MNQSAAPEQDMIVMLCTYGKYYCLKNNLACKTSTSLTGKQPRFHSYTRQEKAIK